MGLDRRQAIRTAAALAVGTAGAAGCDAGGPAGTTAGTAGGTPSATRSGGASAAPPGSAPPLPGGALPAEVVHGPRDQPKVALTFHGQGDPALIRSLLTVLADGGVRVTVLAVGTWLAANPQLARLVLSGGHELGNHTQNHLAINRLSQARAHAEISTCAQALRSLTGSIGAWFRPSQTPHASAQVRALATRVGYPTCLSYDVDSLDYTDPPADTVVRETLKGVQPGSIVSMHFGHQATITAMPRVLSGLRSRGLRAVTVTELIGAR
ncbi:MAG: hypothetical protein V7603_2726 [Micromonosporaceae bacterium]